MRIAATAAERAGASVSALALPEIVAEAWRIHTIDRSNSRRIRLSPGSMARTTMPWRRCCASGSTTAGAFAPAAYDAARTCREAGAARVELRFSKTSTRCSTFSAPGVAPKGLASTGDAHYNQLWTLMGTPCVNVPAYVADGGLPVGVQVIARFGDDAGALKVAHFVEQALAR